MSSNSFAVIRHLRDKNALKSYSMDGPLEENQENALDNTVDIILQEMKRHNKDSVHLIYTTSVKRITGTAKIFAKKMQEKHVKVSFHDNELLEVMDQGDLNLPSEYKDGDWFHPLDVAWDAICDEAYLYDNLFYKFGSYKGKFKEYPELKDAFSRPGESMGWSLINKYDFISDVIENKLDVKDNEFLVIVCQSDLPLLLLELQELSKDPTANYINFPRKSWEVYKQGGLQDKMGYDIPMGYTQIFDLSELEKSGFSKEIRRSGQYLRKQQAIHNYQDVKQNKKITSVLNKGNTFNL